MSRAVNAAVACSLLVLGACSTWQAGRETVVNYASAASVQLVRDAVFVICKGAPVGAIRSVFGGSPDMIDAWLTICNDRSDLAPFDANIQKEAV